jgi:uncharacterized Zn finger protein
MCEECKRGPSEQHGHPHLEERFRSGFQQDGQPEFVTLECRSCGTYWTRSGSPDRPVWRTRGADGV